MAVSLKHKFESLLPDEDDASLVRPSDWNDEHELRMAGGKVLGRDTTGPGVVQELPIAVDSTGNVSLVGSLTLPGADPTAPTQAAHKGYVDAQNAAQDAAIAGGASRAYVDAENDAQDAANATADNLRVLKAGDTMTGPLLIPNGLVGTPAFAFAGNPNTGLYSSGTGQQTLTANGVDKLTISNIGATLNGVWRGNPGSATAPAFSFSGETGLGMWRAAAGSLGFTVSGVNRVTLTATAMTLTVPVVLPADPTTALQAATKQYVDSKISIGDAPPGSPAPGMLWWESDTGLLYIYYNDGDTSQWVSTGPALDPSLYYSKTEADAKFVDVAGDTMTGELKAPMLSVDANFKQYLSGANPVLQFDLNDYFVFDRAANVLSYWVGAAAKATFGATGNLDIAGGMSVAGDASFGLNKSGADRHLYFTTNTYLQNQNSTADLLVVAAGAVRQLLYASGIVTITAAAYKPGGGVWSDSSDARIKDVHGTYDAGLAEILALNPVRFSFKGNDDPPTVLRQDGEPEPFLSPHGAQVGQEFIGLIAQEVEPVMPEMISLREGFIDGKPVDDIRTLDASALTYALVNAVKELNAKVAALEAQIGAP
jgi:hypothetical protein